MIIVSARETQLLFIVVVTVLRCPAFTAPQACIQVAAGKEIDALRRMARSGFQS
jgi:hypothetical protein